MRQRYEHVVDLGLRLDKLNDSVLEEVALEVSRFLESKLRKEPALGRMVDLSSVIYVENTFEVLRVRVLLEVVSPKPVVNELKELLDRIIDEAFNHIERLLAKVGLEHERLERAH